jgi:hypothetical protein
MRQPVLPHMPTLAFNYKQTEVITQAYRVFTTRIKRQRSSRFTSISLGDKPHVNKYLVLCRHLIGL